MALCPSTRNTNQALAGLSSEGNDLKIKLVRLERSIPELSSAVSVQGIQMSRLQQHGPWRDSLGHCWGDGLALARTQIYYLLVVVVSDDGQAYSAQVKGNKHL